MSQPQFTLSWDAFQQNICNGLGTLQQNEEFVDMTIAADGHFVRVHQIVLSLASPYIKELIKSAQCRNPVIFLNDHLVSLSIKNANNQASYERNTSSEINTSTKYVKDRYTEIKNSDHEYIDDAIEFCDAERMDDTTDDTTNIETQSQIRERKKTKQMMVAVNKDPIKPTETPDSLQIQYCVSNQGSLQMILNRYLYYLRYSSKTGHRHWRCTDYIKKKCPAAVSTKDDIVLRRTSAHIHPFHDGKIAKKVRDNTVFSLISEAELHGDLKKTKNHDDTS
ncbi:protein bric-a-brac 1 isoform X2 [Amyelois transitella]|uniref:protein bric-a-brac 1 isoform X2 n=1 Tax=Amyelois transitella TaxID=680683 RepID=UPI00298F868B|nr:protein bric-a-brac 1 isoform X2 [Amyelois transitella]